MRTFPPTHVLFSLVVLSIFVGGIEVASYLHGMDLSTRALTLWGVVFSLLVAMWVETDSRHRANVYRPFEFGALVFATSLVYLPYYLWCTRGLKGIIWLVALVALYQLGFLVQVGIWFAL